MRDHDHEIWKYCSQELHALMEPIQAYLYSRFKADRNDSEIHRLATELTLACASLNIPGVALFGRFRVKGVKPYWLSRLWGEELLVVSERLEFPQEIVQKCEELAEAERPLVEYVACNYRD